MRYVWNRSRVKRCAASCGYTCFSSYVAVKMLTSYISAITYALPQTYRYTYQRPNAQHMKTDNSAGNSRHVRVHNDKWSTLDSGRLLLYIPYIVGASHMAIPGCWWYMVGCRVLLYIRKKMRGVSLSVVNALVNWLYFHWNYKKYSWKSCGTKGPNCRN